MNGEPLHPDVINISESARGKRIQYSSLWREKGVVSKREIEFLRVSDLEIDGLLFQYEGDNDSFWISEYKVNIWPQLALGSWSWWSIFL